MKDKVIEITLHTKLWNLIMAAPVLLKTIK